MTSKVDEIQFYEGNHIRKGFSFVFWAFSTWSGARDRRIILVGGIGRENMPIMSGDSIWRRPLGVLISGFLSLGLVCLAVVMVWSGYTGSDWHRDLAPLFLVFFLLTPVPLLAHWYYVAFIRHREDCSKMKEAGREIQDILNSLNEGLFAVDTNGVCTRVNLACVRLLGYDSADEIIGKNTHELFHNRNENGSVHDPEKCRMYQAFRSGQTYHVEDEIFWRKDGTPLPVEYWSHPIVREGEVVGAVATFIDIRRRREAERNLRAAKERAERANQAKSDFISGLSHELRTPLNAIMGFTQLLEMEEVSKTDTRKYLGEIKLAGNHILELVNHVLDLAKLEAGRLFLENEPVDLAKMVDQARAMLEPELSRHSVSLETRLDPVPEIIADPTRLRQIILNLLTNAIKYNQPGGSVTITLKRTSAPQGEGTRQVAGHPPEKNWVRLTVSDTGPGIPLEKQKELFQPFNRLGVEKTKTPGVGIGLAMTKKIVEQMGGELSLDSVPGRGSDFSVDLPLAGS